MVVLFTLNLQTKFEMSSFIRSKDMAWAPKCINESREPDHAHLGDSQHHKANTSRGQVVYEVLKSLAVAVEEIFQRVQKSKKCHVILTTPTWGTVSRQKANKLTLCGQLVYNIWSLWL